MLAVFSAACTDSEEIILESKTYYPVISGEINESWNGTQTLKAYISKLPEYTDFDYTINVYMGKTADKESMELYYSHSGNDCYSFSSTICTLTDDKNLKGTYYYYLKCRLKNANYEFESQVDKFTIKAEMSADAEVSTEEVVDLGLSVKWRGYNLGATYPQEYGETYGWGQTATSEYLSGNNPPVEISGTEYDIAHTTLGGTWRMPTKEQYNELVDNCLWVAAQYRGIYGYKVVGPSGNAIFLPIQYIYDSEVTYKYQYYFYYWTGSLWIDYNKPYAVYKYYESKYSTDLSTIASKIPYKYLSSTKSSTKCAIRPVCD